MPGSTTKKMSSPRTDSLTRPFASPLWKRGQSQSMTNVSFSMPTSLAHARRWPSIRFVSYSAPGQAINPRCATCVSGLKKSDGVILLFDMVISLLHLNATVFIMKCNAIETNTFIVAHSSQNRYRNFAKFDNSCALLIAAGFYRPVLVILTELLRIIQPNRKSHVRNLA